MFEFCLKREIEKRLPADDKFTIALILFCCSYCKKIQNKTEIDPLYKLFGEPLLISLKKDDLALFRAMGSNILENTAKQFKSPKSEQKEMHRIIEAARKAASTGNNRHLIECLSQISPSTYLKLMARWHFNEVYDAAFAAALCYFSAKINICYMAFRTQFIYKDDNQIFFDVGVSLDEGCVEYLTQEMFKSSGEKCMEDAYFFEVEFYKNVKKQFELSKQDEGKVIFSNGGPTFLYNKTKNLDKCLFYNLFYLSDNQNWREVYQVLKNIKESTSDGIN